MPLQQFHMQSRQGLCKLASGSGIGSTEQIANHRTDRAIKKYALKYFHAGEKIMRWNAECGR